MANPASDNINSTMDERRQRRDFADFAQLSGGNNLFGGVALLTVMGAQWCQAVADAGITFAQSLREQQLRQR